MAKKEWLAKGVDGLSFGERLGDLIAKKGITQAELAKSTGLGQSRLSDYIAGKEDDPEKGTRIYAAPDCATVITLAKYFSVSTDYLLGLTEVPTPETDIRATAELTGLSQQSVINLRLWKMNSINGRLRIINQFFSDPNFFSLIDRIIRYLDVVKKVDPALAVHRETLDFIREEAGDDLIKEIQLHESLRERILTKEEVKKAEDMRDVEYLRVHRAFSELMTSMGERHKKTSSTEGSAINGND